MLASELKMLQSYKIDAEILYEDYKAEFASDMSEIKSLLVKDKKERSDDSSSEDHNDVLTIDPNSSDQRWKKTETGWQPEDDLDDNSDSQKKPAPDWAKKLYKRIALASHPDRTLDQDNKGRLNKIFTESASAMDTGDFNKLVGFALDLDIDLLAADIDHIPVLSSRISKVKEELSAIEQNLEWIWGESLGVLDLRKKIAHRYFAQNGYDLNTDDLESIIQKLEGK